MTRSWHKPDRNSAVQQSATYQVCYLFDRKVAAAADPFADEVTLSRKRAKSRTPITGLRSKTTKARTRVDRLRAANADLKKKLAEALEQQTATSEILGVIAASPTNIQPVLQAVAESACRLCEAYDSVIRLCEGERLCLRAHHGPIPVDFFGSPIGRDWVTGRAFVDREPVHVHDLQAAADEFPDGSAYARRLGHRTILAVPLLRENEAIGVLVIRR